MLRIARIILLCLVHHLTICSGQIDQYEMGRSQSIAPLTHMYMGDIRDLFGDIILSTLAAFSDTLDNIEDYLGFEESNTLLLALTSYSLGSLNQADNDLILNKVIKDFNLSSGLRATVQVNLKQYIEIIKPEDTLNVFDNNYDDG